MATIKSQLSDVTLDEVSLVDNPAAHLSKVVLLKRNDTVGKSTKGVQFNIGFKEDGTSGIQSVVFDKDLWDEEEAKGWLEDHKMHAGEADVTENTMRFRQADPKEYSRFRMIRPGSQVSKVLRANQSLSRLQSFIERALQEKIVGGVSSDVGFIKPLPWIRDMFENSVIYDYEGKTYRVDYEADLGGKELEVTLGEPVMVEVAYVDVAKAKKPPTKKPKEKDMEDELASRLSQTEVRLKGVKDKLEKFNPWHDTRGRFANARQSSRFSPGGRDIGTHTRTAAKMTSEAKKETKSALASGKPQNLRNAADLNLKAAKTWRKLEAKHPKNSTQQLEAQRKAKLHSSIAAKLTRRSRSANPAI